MTETRNQVFADATAVDDPVIELRASTSSSATSKH